MYISCCISVSWHLHQLLRLCVSASLCHGIYISCCVPVSLHLCVFVFVSCAASLCRHLLHLCVICYILYDTNTKSFATSLRHTHKVICYIFTTQTQSHLLHLYDTNTKSFATSLRHKHKVICYIFVSFATSCTNDTKM